MKPAVCLRDNTIGSGFRGALDIKLLLRYSRRYAGKIERCSSPFQIETFPFLQPR